MPDPVEWGRNAGRQSARAAARYRREHPARPHVILRRAIREAPLYALEWEFEVWNPWARSRSGLSPGAFQWAAALVLLPNQTAGAIDLDNAEHDRHARYLEEKRTYFDRLGMAYLILPRDATKDVLKMLLWRWAGKHKEPPSDA